MLLLNVILNCGGVFDQITCAFVTCGFTHNFSNLSQLVISKVCYDFYSFREI